MTLKAERTIQPGLISQVLPPSWQLPLDSHTTLQLPKTKCPTSQFSIVSKQRVKQLNIHKIAKTFSSSWVLATSNSFGPPSEIGSVMPNLWPLLFRLLDPRFDIYSSTNNFFLTISIKMQWCFWYRSDLQNSLTIFLQISPREIKS